MLAATFSVVQNRFSVIIPSSKRSFSSPHSIHKVIPLPTSQRIMVITPKTILTKFPTVPSSLRNINFLWSLQQMSGVALLFGDISVSVISSYKHKVIHIPAVCQFLIVWITLLDAYMPSVTVASKLEFLSSLYTYLPPPVGCAFDTADGF